MIRKAFWSLAIVLLAYSSGSAADVRRVVTGLDASNKAVVLFDSRVTLNPGGSGNPAANLWITDSSPPALSFKDDNAAKRIGLSPPDKVPRFAWSNFHRLIQPPKRRWIPIS
jgi:hypothetical protein